MTAQQTGPAEKIDAAARTPPLVMRFGALGDMVLLTVLLRHLHERFGKPVDVISSGAWTRPLLQDHPAVGRLFLIRSRRMPYLLSTDQWKLNAWLRKRAPGPVWYCDMKAGKDHLLRAGIPDDYIFDATAFAWRPGESFADRYIRMGNESPAAFAGHLPPPIPGGARAAEINVTPAARASTDEWLARRGLTARSLIVVHPGSRHVARRWLRPRTGVDKHWPEDRWVEVIRRVRELRPDHAILLSGTRAERSLNEEIKIASGVKDIQNVADDTPIAILLGLLERAHSMISVDTGPAHVAAALGCPTVALFGTADAALFRPGGATTPAIALTGAVDGRQSILGITVQSVMAAWLDLLRQEDREAHSVKSVTRG